MWGQIRRGAIPGVDRLTAGAFSMARYLGDRLLPEPYTTRFRAKSELVQGALTATESQLPAVRRLALAWSGYDERLYFAYGFDRGVNPSPYLSDYTRRCAKRINPRPELLRNKATFHAYLSEQGLARYLPACYGLIEDGRFRSETGEGLRTIARRNDGLVIKEVYGGGGNRVYLGECDGADLVLHGKDGPVEDTYEVVRDIDRAIVTEYCRQAAYLDEVYPGAPNTIRVITMCSAEGDVFIPAAVHRFGTSTTGALDNFSQGGLSALVSVDTGRLSRAAQITDARRVRWHSTHPDTGARIEGLTIPVWPTIRRRLRRIAARLPDVRYAGWDLLVTAPGEFVLLEANHFPDPDVIQVHEPLLTDPRVRQFFAAHGVPV